MKKVVSSDVPPVLPTQISPLATKAMDFLSPYTNNGNTGNCYEIFVGMDILRKMGLTNADIDSTAQLLTDIKSTNAKANEKIEMGLATIRSNPVGNGCRIDGHNVVGLRNVTQDDSDGNTGDIVLCLDNGTERSISVFSGKVTQNGSIEKCLTNPTCSRYGCTDGDKEKFKDIASQAVVDYKKEMTYEYGSNEDTWNRKPSKTAVTATATVAAITAARFNSLPVAERLAHFMDLTRTNNNGKPADLLCVVNKNCKKYSLLNIVKSNITSGDVSLRADSFWLYMSVDGNELVKTQVKFNNGVYHKGKTSSLTTSWNATCYMNKVFTLEHVCL